MGFFLLFFWQIFPTLTFILTLEMQEKTIKSQKINNILTKKWGGIYTGLYGKCVFML